MKLVTSPRRFTAAIPQAGFRPEQLGLPECTLEQQFWAGTSALVATPTLIGAHHADFSNIQPTLTADGAVFDSCSSSHDQQWIDTFP